jgi:hypothetical protein
MAGRPLVPAGGDGARGVTVFDGPGNGIGGHVGDGGTFVCPTLNGEGGQGGDGGLGGNGNVGGHIRNGWRPRHKQPVTSAPMDTATAGRTPKSLGCKLFQEL